MKFENHMHVKGKVNCRNHFDLNQTEGNEPPRAAELPSIREKKTTKKLNFDVRGQLC